MVCSVYHHILKILKEITPGIAASCVRPRQPVLLSQLMMAVREQAQKASSRSIPTRSTSLLVHHSE
ncbi:hypothetical protein ANCCAN_10757 [Ancylostoma caninum]|uniref:Uncharacterized protein n=1 Tax=Ancylostoma caninum TaxID=29170 RepID=A0A368GHU3_ANCCA|nr:hypothetical protein ANCCAN_10757 [Ancylostoma caninum]